MDEVTTTHFVWGATFAQRNAEVMSSGLRFQLGFGSGFGLTHEYASCTCCSKDRLVVKCVMTVREMSSRVRV